MVEGIDTDIFPAEKRSEIMSNVKSANTKPELIIRSMLHRLGYRYRLHKKNLPGKPDIVLSKYNLIIFINGCFWHQHPGCKKATIPKKNQSFWREKLMGNVKRDQLNLATLKANKWHVVVLWECEIKKSLPSILKRLDPYLNINSKIQNL